MSVLHGIYAVAWLATWGNNMAWLESLLILGGAAFWKRDKIGRHLAAWWAKHHGEHAIEQQLEALRRHEEAKRREGSA